MGRFRMAVGCLVLAAGAVSASARESVGVRGRALDGGENKKNAPRVAVDNPGPGSANDIVGGSRDDGNRHDGNTDEQAIRIERAEPEKASRIDEGGDDENNAGGEDRGVQHIDRQSGNPDIASHHIADGGGEHGDDQNNRAQHPGGHRHFGENPLDGDLANGGWNTPEHHGFDRQHGNNQRKSDLDGERHDDEPVGTPGNAHANRNVDQDTGEGADHHHVGDRPRNRGGERSADGDDVVDVEAAPRAALSKALSDAYSARAAAARGAAGEIFLFLAGGIFGGILAAMFANWARMVKGNEETGSEDPAGESSPTVSGKHESWRKKDRGLPHGEMSDVPLELPLDGTGLVPVVLSEAPASGNSTAVHKHESWQKRDRGVPHGDLAMSDVPLELPLDGTNNLGPVVLSEAPPASGSSTGTAVRKHEGWQRRDRLVAVASAEEDPFNFGVAGNLVPVENHEREGRGLPHHPNSFSLT